jgi:hypothetical protein
MVTVVERAYRHPGRSLPGRGMYARRRGTRLPVARAISLKRHLSIIHILPNHEDNRPTDLPAFQPRLDPFPQFRITS